MPNPKSVIIRMEDNQGNFIEEWEINRRTSKKLAKIVQQMFDAENPKRFYCECGANYSTQEILDKHLKCHSEQELRKFHNKIQDNRTWCPDCKHFFEGSLCMDCMPR